MVDENPPLITTSLSLNFPLLFKLWELRWCSPPHVRLIPYFRKWKMNCYCKHSLLSLLPTKANLALPFPQVRLISKREHNAFGRVWISAFFVETISEYRLRALCVSRPPVRWWHTIYQQSMPLSICFSRRGMCYSLKVCGTAEAVASLFLPPLVSAVCLCGWVGLHGNEGGTTGRRGRKKFRDNELVMQGLPVGQWAQSLFQISYSKTAKLSSQQGFDSMWWQLQVRASTVPLNF